MKKLVFYKIYSCILLFLFLELTGCSKNDEKPIDDQQMEMPFPSEETAQIEEVDWSNYFDGITGTAVVYEPAENHYQIYN